MESILEPVRPVSPVAAYVGGKRLLAKRLIERIAVIPHTTYVEPFIGMGGVFLRRPFKAKGEVINDISKDVVTLFRILQRHYVPLMDMLKWQLTSRSEWQRLMTMPPDSLTDLERAARFLYLQRIVFGGKPGGKSFAVSLGMPARFNVMKLADMLEDVHERLSSVVIENLPYADLIERYDRPDTLFYLDPPYWGCEDYYGKNIFERADFERIAAILDKIKGHFILSLNDHEGVRDVFKRFSIEAVGVTYSLSRKGDARREFGELIISGGGA